MTPLKLTWAVLIMAYGCLIGWAIVHYLDGITREGWITMGAAATAVCLASLLLDLTAVAVLAAAAAAVHFALASRPPGGFA